MNEGIEQIVRDHKEQQLRDFFAAWDAHDGERLAAMLAPDVSYTDHAAGETFTSPAQVKKFVEIATQVFSSNYRFEVTRVLVDRDGYAAEWTMTGTHDRADPVRGMPATGKPFTLPGSSIGRWRNGLVVEHHDYWNLAAFMVQVGLLPQPDPTGSPG